MWRRTLKWKAQVAVAGGRRKVYTEENRKRRKGENDRESGRGGKRVMWEGKLGRHNGSKNVDI